MSHNSVSLLRQLGEEHRNWECRQVWPTVCKVQMFDPDRGSWGYRKLPGFFRARDILQGPSILMTRVLHLGGGSKLLLGSHAMLSLCTT